jgi:DNA-binding NarL/FixJ family response regulator
MGSWLRVVILDDNTSIHQMLRHLVEHMNGEVIGEAADGRARINAVERLQPDVLLLDVSMPVMGGFEAARQLHESMPVVAIIFVSQHPNQANVDEAFQCGAKGYVLKRAAAAELHDAIHAVMTGNLFRSPRITP